MNPRSASVAVLLVLGAASGCSSSSAGAGTGADSGSGADSASGADSGGDASGGGAEDDGSAPIADAHVDRSSSQVDASAACVSYCACMAMNCAGEVFPSGCLYECTAQTNWDLECRANMCSLVPSEPANDHCTHAFGMNECLNE